MAEITPFAGLDALLPGEPTSTDGYKFQLLDRFIIDRILKVGAVTHRHDGHAAMANPTAAPMVATAATGGTIPGGTPLSVVYTLIDSDGGESLPVAPTVVTTAGGYQDPFDVPTVVVDYTTGTLLADNYSYGVTVTDSLGGETAISPAALATVLSGNANAEVTISGLIALTNDASGGDSAAGWRLWRSQGGGPWYLIGTGSASMDSLVDNGIAGDCTVAPPDQGTTIGANTLSVTVPSAGQPSGVVNFNIYVTIDGSFTSPALLGTYSASALDATQTYAALSVAEGAPPTVSTCLPGANPITSADLLLHWLPPVASIAALPLSGNQDGDVRVSLDSDQLWTWDAPTSAWKLWSPQTVLTTTQQPTNYTLAITDASTVVEFTAAVPSNCTVPPHSVVAFPVGTIVEIFQYGAGQVVVVAGAGVTLRSDGALVGTGGQYATVGLRQRAVNEWVLSGDLA
jgi:hypothetical protein